MRIFVNAQSAHFGGGLEYLKNQLKTLLRQKHDIKLIIWTNNKNIKELMEYLGENRIIYINYPYLPYYMRFIIEQMLCPILSQKYRADIIYMPGNSACFLTLKKQVLVFQNPNLFFDVVKKKSPSYLLKRWIQRLIARASMLRADRIVFISKDLKHRALKGSKENVFILYSGVNIEGNYKNFDTEKFKPYILAVSNITYHKNYPALLEAFEIFHRDFRQFHLVVAGKIMDKVYFERITAPYRNKEVWNNIHFLGGVEHEALPALYKNATLYITTTLLEAFPLTPFEAMYFCTPVISSKASSLPEICGNAALYIDPQNPEDIAEKIKLLIRDDKLRMHLVQKGKERVQKFSWEKHADEFYRIIKS